MPGMVEETGLVIIWLPQQQPDLHASVYMFRCRTLRPYMHPKMKHTQDWCISKLTVQIQNKIDYDPL